ncbi:SPOR domain-containing protein [Sphingomonas montanisoli]|uniref:SPOR domain-containing protein n=1 Tax=Sphingomonas montanisoli TaxID=2606412 RepID=A0A5D9C9A8_9SPHN|nr:SPOR domain-containing protein [Sphingomonas montanisoli]TZG27732.1 SPOR domain-containing protein [Sphingomonas montanisoli]
MTDYSRDRLGPDDEERLPWLEPVEEDYEEERGLSPAKIAIGVIILLVVIGMIAGSVLWLRGRGDVAASGDGSVIRAPDDYYKQRPENPGGMDVGSGDEIVYSASQGNEVASEVDTRGAAEAPINVDRAQAPVTVAIPPSRTAQAGLPPAATAPAKTADAAVPTKVAPPVAKPAAPKPVAAAPVASAPAPASGGSMVQLGAFSSPAKANSAWKSLSGRFSFLSGLTQSVAPVQSGDKTLYRLRASGGDARNICARLKTAGESCSVIG